MTEEQKAAAHRIEYFLKAWEYAGVGKTIKTVQDSPDTHAAIDVADLRAILQAATRDDLGDRPLFSTRQNAARYQWLKASNKLDGWTNEMIDRQIAIDAQVVAASAPKGDGND